MTLVELRAAIKFGTGLIEEYKKEGREVPSFVYERQIELYEQLVEALSIGE